MDDQRVGDPTRPAMDENTVDWDGPDDPQNPRNWPLSKKYGHAAMVSAIALIVNLASTMFAPAAPLLVEELSISSSTVGSLTVSIYLLGFAFGPLLMSPLSEMCGRSIVYQACNLAYLAFTLGCALSTNVGMFLAFRFIAGCAGSAPMTIGGGTIADLFPQEKRGSMMGMLTLGPVLGPVVGPIAGGFIAQDVGWRWTFWVILIMSGVVNVVAVVWMRETYAPVLLQRKTIRLRKTTNNPALRSILDKDLASSIVIMQSVIRPLKLLIFSPIVLFLSLYTAFAFGLTFILFTTFPAVYSEKYHFGTGVSGLAYLGMGIGFFIGIVVFATTSDKVLQVLATRDKVKLEKLSGIKEENDQVDSTGTKYKPEYRLVFMAYLTPILPIGFFWYGWSADQGAHWIVPILGTGLIGIGALFIMMPGQTYLVDVFGSEAAASALAANTLLRSLFGAFLPMAGPAMYESLGLGWGNSLLGFIGLAFIPIPYFFYKYGEQIRKRWPVNL
ncbi:major facilitator superfamily domain-containing protein [Massariosphaeria phaeospora]|uniref:Major facilitator superfamily domain-containing protein n=1 Tax=Massariosphaeria phaeospora TaxID=100035 RepID=A0A7C8M9N6_9PLEO|nr:major facilitator superfamily domain-containing protein [Massariosphaeria phaeospora]